MLLFFRVLAIIFIASGLNAVQNNNLKIYTSIAPLQSLVAMVGDGVISSEVIMQTTVSPHDSELTYNQIRKIKSADVLFIFSSDLERDIANVAKKSKTNLVVINNNRQLIQYGVNSKNYKDAQPQKSNKMFIPDNHTWLDPNNAKIMLTIICKELSAIDPNNKHVYLANMKKYSKKLDELNTDSINILASKHTAFMTYHNAWQYFIKRYSLESNYYGSIMANDEQHHHVDSFLSTKNIIDLTSYIQKYKIACIFVEPQFNDATLKSFIKNNNIKSVALDPIGTLDNPNVQERYFDMMKKNAQNIKSCL